MKKNTSKDKQIEKQKLNRTRKTALITIMMSISAVLLVSIVVLFIVFSQRKELIQNIRSKRK